MVDQVVVLALNLLLGLEALGLLDRVTMVAQRV
jgi:hypothetical protein